VLHLHLLPRLGVTPFEFRWDLWHQITGVHGLWCSIIYVIISSAHRHRQTDRHTTTAYKLAFHDADTDSDSPDTPTYLYVRGVRVGVVECQLYGASITSRREKCTIVETGIEDRRGRTDGWLAESFNACLPQAGDGIINHDVNSLSMWTLAAIVKRCHNPSPGA